MGNAYNGGSSTNGGHYPCPVNERNKKQSFENRAGFIMTLLGAICIFLFETVKLQDIISFMSMPLTFMELIKIISGLAVYVCFVFTMIMTILTIIVKQHNNFEVKNIDEALLAEQRLYALCRLILTYKSISAMLASCNEGAGLIGNEYFTYNGKTNKAKDD